MQNNGLAQEYDIAVIINTVGLRRKSIPPGRKPSACGPD